MGSILVKCEELGEGKHKKGVCNKMRKAKPSGKRVLASLLAVGMIAGLVPVNALADEAETTASSQTAVVESVTESEPETAEATAQPDETTRPAAEGKKHPRKKGEHSCTDA